ncbi:MAG TPA: GGDEF domain-containing protein [Actinomycetota bacterium]|nr:GGDEF domain-containing protein [Actinomycetota bacterium]
MAYIDFITGADVALSFFYLIPVIVATRLMGMTVGVALAIFGAAADPLTLLIAGEAYDPLVAFWNLFVRAATLVTAALLVGRLDAALAHERELSRTDPLTKLMNTRSFRARADLELMRAVRYRRPLTLAFMDLDNFKLVNDELGHAEGDDLLARVASLLTSLTRSVDVVGRLGGDEFALLMPETGRMAATRVIERMRHELKEMLVAAHLPESVSVSIGMVTTAGPGADLDALVLIADQLMYSAKRAGKNRVNAKDLTEGGTGPDPVSEQDAEDEAGMDRHETAQRA